MMINKKPLVSAIIPNYNYSRFVSQAVDSALRQTYPNVEVIVVDDGSKDNSIEILQKFGDKIRLVQQKNAGVSAARNNGVAHSNGEFLAFLDADDFWMPEKIEKQVDLFLKKPELGLVHVGVLDINEHDEPFRTWENGQEGWVAEEFLLLSRPVVFGGGSGLMVSHKAFTAIGGFDTELATAADWDLFYRLSCLYPIGFVPEVLLTYRFHNSNMSSNVQRMEREMMRGYQKAFQEKNEKVQKIRRTAYGNLHKVLAGSYFHAREYGHFLKHSVQSIWLHPRNLGYFCAFPLRLIQRQQNSTSQNAER
jgi:glycosyltransferase involved in cell wall biosynthesis